MQALQMRAAEADKVKHAGNLEAGKKFLEENAKKPGVKTTASGLQYEVLKDGSGAKPTLQSKVKVHYHGTLIDGKVFDSSVNRGEPITFPLNGVIQGWQEGVQLMPVGSKYRFYIPYNLAYGERGAGANIPPYSALIFDVELLAIEK
jgi:FKBP-type peptidyl-prolyl cis-trans isomerase FklB